MKQKIKTTILFFTLFSIIFVMNQLLNYFQISVIPVLLLYALVFLITILIVFSILNRSAPPSIPGSDENPAGSVTYPEKEEQAAGFARDDYLVRVHDLQDDFTILKKTVMPLCLQLEDFSKKMNQIFLC